jgi:hypothetical protein
MRFGRFIGRESSNMKSMNVCMGHNSNDLARSALKSKRFVVSNHVSTHGSAEISSVQLRGVEPTEVLLLNCEIDSARHMVVSFCRSSISQYE